ncbi:hypothetical protein Poli38472_009346 [Pythium oligandrum]|uniref:Uncharacterized protein n=1 Tax=Pythium oligandrum TaxID=41045 RepID=A0A8K1CLC6_PYTOL|nr:hypothetical protein Poli38472_009346 [Pythium oligandrum]|eukprot:TMW65179.1 hypothetical protein Poli38472_009346 [Pythium oligandrum]
MLDSGLAYITHRVLNQTIDCSNYNATGFMLRHGMDVQADSGELGPLHTAAQEEYEEDFFDSVRTVHFLVTEGFADVNAQCSKGMTPLMGAVSKPPPSLRCGELDILTKLLQYGADLDMRDKEGETALHKAHPETLLPLLMHGANPNTQDHRGSAVLHKLAEQTGNEDNTAQLDVMVSFQANSYIKNENGVSPYSMLMQSERGQNYIKSRAHYFA